MLNLLLFDRSWHEAEKKEKKKMYTNFQREHTMYMYILCRRNVGSYIVYLPWWEIYSHLSFIVFKVKTEKKWCEINVVGIFVLAKSIFCRPGKKTEFSRIISNQLFCSILNLYCMWYLAFESIIYLWNWINWDLFEGMEVQGFELNICSSSDPCLK